MFQETKNIAIVINGEIDYFYDCHPSFLEASVYKVKIYGFDISFIYLPGMS